MTAMQQLAPFGGQGPPGVRIQASAAVRRHGSGQASLQLQIALQGADALQLPEPSRPPQRRDGLWQHTCLEAFLAPLGQEAYWEFNLAPSGDWNVYRLSGYRQGLEPEPFYRELPVALRSEASPLGPSALRLALRCPLPPELAAAPALEAGLSAVLENRDSAISYWALAHPAAEADFHHRGGWRLRL